MFSDLWFRARALLRRKTMESEMDEELRAHFDHEVAKYVRTGLSPQEAARRARLAVGGFEQIKEACREARGTHLLESCWQDLRYAVRMLRKTPGFTYIAFLILAVGIGSNAAVFSLIDALLLRSLQVPEPRQLVHITFGPPGETQGPLSGPMFDRLRERQSAFTDVFAWTNLPMVFNEIRENGGSRPIQAAYATGSAFPTLRLKPRLGRLLDWQDDAPSSGSSGFAAVISEAFWIDHFRGDPGALGQTLVVNGATAKIVGVMPRSFNGITVDYAPQVVLPFAFDVALHGAASGRFRPDWHWMFTMARLKSGVSHAQAQANLSAIAEGVLKDSQPANFQRHDYLRKGQLVLSPGRTGNSPLGEAYGRSLWTLQALVGLLMLICCANLASLQISRTLSRRHELIVRSTLGAGRLRLVRQLVIECAVLSVCGATAGVLLSQWMSALLVTYVEQSDFPVYLDLHPNAAIFGATLVLAGLVIILAGVLPALRLTRFDAQAALRSGTQRPVVGQQQRFAARLMPMQVAFALLLASVALLFAVSAGKLLRMDPGFRVKGVTFFRVDFERRPEKGNARFDLYHRMLESLRNSPGVEAASILRVHQLLGGGLEESQSPVEGNGPEEKHLAENIVGTDYFRTAGTELLAGRDFSELDRSNAAHVCILNRAAATFFFRGQTALGKHIRSNEPNAPQPVCEVIGIVADAKYVSLRQPAPPTIYYTYEQSSDINWAEFITQSRNAFTAVAAFKEALQRVVPDTPLMAPITMERQLEDSIGQERLLAALSCFFGVLALLLTAIGLYGLESQRVAHRVPEIGLRIALGAQKRDMLWFVFREAALLMGIGAAVGVCLALGASGFIRSLLYDVSPINPRIHAAAVFAMLVLGFLAAYAPARRAMRIDPMEALRHE